MKKYFFSFLLYISVCNSSYGQKTINGVTLPAVLKKDSAVSVLNGVGIRKKMFFKLYVAGLYVPTKTTNAEEIINCDRAVAMRLTITSGVITSDNMSDGIEEDFKRSTNGNTASLQPRIETFINTFKKDPIKEGDIFEIWYLPETGVQTYKNTKLQNTIPGLDFKKALFAIWFSDNPVDADLKKGLLGL